MTEGRISVGSNQRLEVYTITDEGIGVRSNNSGVLPTCPGTVLFRDVRANGTEAPMRSAKL